MRLDGYNFEFTLIPGAVAALGATVDAAQWREACRRAAFDGGRLVALWADDNTDIGGTPAILAALAPSTALAHGGHSHAVLPDVPSKYAFMTITAIIGASA